MNYTIKALLKEFESVFEKPKKLPPVGENRSKTCQISDLLSSSCLGTSRPRMVTKSRKMALFTQQMTRKCLPLVDGAGEENAEVTVLAAEGASAAADRLRHSCQNRTSSS